MKDLIVLLIHLMATVAKLMGPGGTKAVVADSLLLKQQLLVISHARRRAPNLTTFDRFLFGLWSLFINPRRLSKVAVIINPQHS
jgi:putative transposase